MKKSLLAILCFTIFTSSSVFACAGFGLTTAELNSSLIAMDELVKADSKFDGLILLSITWRDLYVKAGAEGDCSASHVQGSVQVVAESSTGSYYTFNGSVGLFKSEVFGDHATIVLELE